MPKVTPVDHVQALEGAMPLERRERFVQHLIEWQRVSGRHDLPWQQNKDPYRVWLSEIMLQQTQVATVKSYFMRFIEALPTVKDLAQAPAEQVMALWAGLGYYSRARNLHRCAQQVMEVWGGEFPRTAAELETLSGIGPSTAAAIASTCFHERVAIMDGNVKRVVARWQAFEGDIGDSRSVKHLTELAQSLALSVPVPSQMPIFTQGLMDLGATLCKPKRPACEHCPVAWGCLALKHGQQEVLPIKRSRTQRKTQRWWLIFGCSPDQLWAWMVRPERGIWPGLHTPLIFEDEAAARDWLSQHAIQYEWMPMVKHVLTHRDLFLYPVKAQLGKQAYDDGRLKSQGSWYTRDAVDRLGMPAPIFKLWEMLIR